MTQAQYTSLMGAISDVRKRIDRVEQRLAFVYPTAREISEQIDWEVGEILSEAESGCGVRVFADGA